jgi:hypothetical protein
MAKAKGSQGSTALLEPIDNNKPLVKEFVDVHSQIEDFISLRLPSVAKTYLKMSRVYAAKNGKTFRYRVNYHQEVTNLIVRSRYVEITIDATTNPMSNGTNSEYTYRMNDLTISRPMTTGFIK